MPSPSPTPRVSFIVLSYNYEQYIAQTLRSILDQTFQDFEVVVVDDASKDRSLEVIRGFDDPRIRLHVNEKNLGGAASYNRAVELARGELLVNLDADDWIAPAKTELQLAVLEAAPELDVIGTYVHFVGADGAPHPRAASLEAYTNQPHDLNLVDAWTVQNLLCRSSTLMRRSVHERIGPDEPTMARAPDYELWTRALRAGCRFHVVPEQLTYLRLQSSGVTHADPRGAFREICWLLVKNVVPLIEERALWPTLSRVVEWVVTHEQFARMAAAERYRLLGALLSSPNVADFPGFERLLSTAAPELEATGRRALAVTRTAESRVHAEKLERDVELFVAARDEYRAQSEAFQRASEYHRQQAESWERTAAELREELRRRDEQEARFAATPEGKVAGLIRSLRQRTR